MPLPPQLRKGASKKKVRQQATKVMHELKHSPVTSPARKATHGAQRHRQDVAIMMKNTGQSDKAAIASNKAENGHAGHNPHKPVQPMNKVGKKKKNQ